MNNKSELIESLKNIGGKKNGESIDFLTPSLVIRNKKTRLKYTISSVKFRETGPEVHAFRFGISSDRKVRLVITANEFDDYEVA